MLLELAVSLPSHTGQLQFLKQHFLPSQHNPLEGHITTALCRC